MSRNRHRHQCCLGHGSWSWGRVWRWSGIPGVGCKLANMWRLSAREIEAPSQSWWENIYRLGCADGGPPTRSTVRSLPLFPALRHSVLLFPLSHLTLTSPLAMSSIEAAPDAKVSKGIDPAHIEKHGAFEEDGGIHDRPAMERKLLWKLDARFSILIIMYELLGPSSLSPC